MGHAGCRFGLLNCPRRDRLPNGPPVGILSDARKVYMNTVDWIKSKADTWLEFEAFDLSTANADGVYMIWHGGNPGHVVYVGQGDVRSRLTAHRSNPTITQYRARGKLYVTWASVPAYQKDGIERYLANHWDPLVGDAHPQATPIAVNSPW
jgi:hypothetical protein